MADAPIVRITHPDIGVMVNDQWDGDWIFLREFPPFAKYCWCDSSPGFQGTRGEVIVTEPVQRWRDQEPTLVRDRHFPILAQLHHLGVFEVGFEIGSQSRDPASYQTRAYQAFIGAESEISSRVLDALWRYYQDIASGHLDFLFGDDEHQMRRLDRRDDLPYQVEFSSLGVPRCHSGNSAPLVFTFRVEWEQEHGFHIIIHDSQVIGIGCWDDMNDLTRRPSTYSASGAWMSDSEKDALRTYTEGFINGDRQHDI
jgi:hypothetical protein